MLTDRQKQILNIIVDRYIRSSAPVPSDVVAGKMDRPVSSATIRNEMAELDKAGYITRPHTSAGGVPSDKAYRAYVESLYIPDLPRQVQEEIQGRFSQTTMEIEAWGRMAVRMLAGLVHTLAMISFPAAAPPRWRRLELVYLEEFLALLIMVLDESRLRQRLLPLKEAMTQDQLTRVANKLNALYSGNTQKEVAVRDREFAPFESEVVEAAGGLLKQEYDSEPAHFIDGLRHMFAYPELAAGPTARNVLELVEDGELVPVVLSQAPGTDDVNVTIGTEHRMNQLHPFSVVYARYGEPSETGGVVAILGPTRMRYPDAISNVRYFSHLMTEMVGSLHGR